MNTIAPFEVRTEDHVLEWIRTRVAHYPWHEMPDDGSWLYGANLPYMQEFCDYW